MSLADVYARIAEVDRPEVWITLRDQDSIATELAAVEERVARGEDLPLAGRLFAVKNNIDVAGLPTTAACPAFAYQPEKDAAAVARLRAAGAVVLGSTNLDQFATGLVGTRSPYGQVRHASHPERISGGSSSGSSVAVALGLVDFALGTDTAGSGRVPAALHGLYGVKPSPGRVPTDGVVPACRSLDVVTAMAADVGLARQVVDVMAGGSATGTRTVLPARIAVPDIGQLGTLARGWSEAFAETASRAAERGAELVPVDIQPFLALARRLYEGAFVAERYAAVGRFIDVHGTEVDPVVGSIISRAGQVPAWRLFEDLAQRDACRLLAAELFHRADALLLPVTVRHPTLAEVAADPLGVNAEMGRFTNFVNLLDQAAVAVPAGTVDGLPFGVQLVGPADSDDRLVAMSSLVAA
ncbi:MAG TPA: allophanate hydrolase [Propionibacteriaceae bacterium]|nr:allophanate hydrolase [Propionibacteriaceae bacterium]